MRKINWVGISLVVSGAALVAALAGTARMGFAAAVQFWWALPLSVSLVSLLALGIHSLMTGRGRKRPSAFPTPAYLISAPSLAALNLVSTFSLGSSPPAWVGAVMLTLLCLSAGVYYQAVKRLEEE